MRQENSNSRISGQESSEYEANTHQQGWALRERRCAGERGNSVAMQARDGGT